MLLCSLVLERALGLAWILVGFGLFQGTYMVFRPLFVKWIAAESR